MLVVLVNDGVALAPGYEVAVDRERDHEGDREGEGEAPSGGGDGSPVQRATVVGVGMACVMVVVPGVEWCSRFDLRPRMSLLRPTPRAPAVIPGVDPLCRRRGGRGRRGLEVECWPAWYKKG